MNRHETIVRMLSGCPYTKDVAQLYFSQLRCYPSRMEAFRRAIEENPELLKRMVKAGYTFNCEFLTPQMIHILLSVWGWPDEVASYPSEDFKGGEK